MQPRNVWSAWPHARRAGAALVLALMASTALADPPDYCVGTDSELVSALSIAQATPLTIKLQQNTYHLNQTAWNAKLTPNVTGKFAAGSSLLGGYTNATCTTRNIGVGNTIVTDTTQAPDDEVNILGDATIEGITFKLPNGLIIGADSNENAGLPPGSQLTIRRNVFTDTTVADALPLYVYWSEDAAVGGVVRIVDNLLHDNAGGAGTSDAGAIFFYVVAGHPTIEMINNTVVDNTGSLGGFGLLNFGAVPVRAYNNIFYNNAGSDFAVNIGIDTKLYDNVIQTHSWPGTSDNVNTTTADPKLDASFRPIESPASYVINSGTTNVIGGLPPTDLAGRDRQVGTAPDLGAFESTINNLPFISVTTTADSGIGSLRSAIASANANNPPAALVLFDLGPASGCPYTIAPLTPLPHITSSIAFAGYSQDGASANTLPYGFNGTICVILDGSPHNLADGLYVGAAADDSIEMQVSGLAFSGFSHGAISMYGGSGHTITGSKIGGMAGGATLDPSGNGIIIGPAVHDVTIGGGNFGDDYDRRNLIGSATGGGVVVDGATDTLVAGHDNHIVNNFIGVGYNGNTNAFVDRGNGAAGITLAGPGNDVRYNFIAYNGGYGISVTNSQAHDNALTSNQIGELLSLSDSGQGNAGGIVFQNGAHDNTVTYGSIYYNAGTGIRVVNGQHNAVHGVALLGNGGLGIDLAGAGVTANDNDSLPQPVDYANRGLNFPLLDSAKGGHNSGKISGSLLTTPGTYWISIYASNACDPSGHGEGMYYFGGAFATTGNLGANGQFLAPFTIQPAFVDYASTPFITATAEDADGNTSEFSSCIQYVDDTVFANGFD